MEWFLQNAAVPIIVILLGGCGYLIKRVITGERHRENLTSIRDAIELEAALKSQGLTLEDAIAIRDRIQGSRGAVLRSQAKAIVLTEAKEAEGFQLQDKPDREEVPFKDTTVGMKLHAAEELDAVERDMADILADLGQVCSTARSAALQASQASWEAFRQNEAQFSALLYEGGTGAPLIGLARMVELTEQRLADLKQTRQEIRELTGE